jgi:hypothetical protein
MVAVSPYPFAREKRRKRMIRRRQASLAALAALLPAKARAWPTRPIRLIAQHQPPAEFAPQGAADKVFFAALLKELDIKLE